jgi:multidrug efflux pump subunit AcrA (membrane-fusion protein)
VVRDERGASVYVAEPAEGDAYIARRRAVTTGPASNGQVVIQDGIVAGDRVVVAGQTQIADGDRLRITEVPAFTASLD